MPASPSLGAIIPALRRAMCARWGALLPDVTVTYGPANTANPGDYLMIGADDPLRDEGIAGEISEDWSTATREGLDGSGEVTCLAFAWDADATPDAVEAASDRAWAIVSALSDDIDDTPDLDSSGVWSCNVASARESVAIGEYGTSSLISVRIHFDAYRRR